MRIYILLLLFFVALFCGLESHAAFPTHVAPAAVSVKIERRSFEAFINATIEKYNLQAPPYNGEGADNPALSITSLALGIGGLAAIMIALLSFSFLWGLLIVGGMLGIAAIVLGAMGSRRRPMRGIGIAGLVMGIIDVSIALVIGFFALLLIAFLGGF